MMQNRQINDSFAVDEQVELTDGLKGIIRYIGKVTITNEINKKGTFYGIELSKPKGKNDGSVFGKTYFMTKPNHGIFVKIGRIKSKRLQIANDINNPYPSHTTQFFYSLLPVFISYLDNITLCTLLDIKSFCDVFGIKKLLTPQFVMNHFVNDINKRLAALQDLQFWIDKQLNCRKITFAKWNITNFNGNESNDTYKNKRRIALVSLIMDFYLHSDYMRHKIVGIKDIKINEEYLSFWTDYAQKNNSNKLFHEFKYNGRFLTKIKGGFRRASYWSSFEGQFCSKKLKTVQHIFNDGKAFGKNGRLLYNHINRVLLGNMMQLMVKEWIVLNGTISRLSCRSQQIYIPSLTTKKTWCRYTESFSFIFGWISPECVIMLGGSYGNNTETI